VRLRKYIIGILCGLFLIPGTATAYQFNDLKSLVMPGPVSSAHVKYEKNCSECHSPLDKIGQKTLCLECHENVGLDIKKQQGFHGRNPQVSPAECKSCHTDHEGRDADIVGLTRETFDHKVTDFPLTGKHIETTCDQCHVANKKLHEAKTDCFSCHEKDDQHQGEMGKDCASCHTTNLWPKVKFDHSKTKFPLKGSHEKVACNSCHPDTRYKQTPTECVACHGGNDEHEGRFGQDCKSCHTEKDWKKTTFDHGKNTDFALKGKHDTIDCEACHVSTTPKKKVLTKCNDCHGDVDIHKGRNGVKCQECHGETDWGKTSFSHDKDTKYILTGAHKDVDCFACHRGEAKVGAKPRDCVDCHKADDVHKGQMGLVCENCHGETTWSEKINFDHDLTAFPLVGLHAITACDECHTNQQFKDAKTDCVACHKADDSHKKSLGTDCAACHNPNGWDFWQFDHNQQTKFDLDGSHTGLACAACHAVPTTGKIKLSQDCVDCHTADDIHKGRFGTMCKRCHTTENFKTIRIGR